MFKWLTCFKYHTSKNHSTGKKCVGTKFEEVEELVPEFALSLHTDYDIADLHHLVIPPWRLQLTPSQINRVKDVFKEVCDEIRDHKVVPTLDVAGSSQSSVHLSTVLEQVPAWPPPPLPQVPNSLRF